LKGPKSRLVFLLTVVICLAGIIGGIAASCYLWAEPPAAKKSRRISA
jgi:hypothetical protein